MSHQVHLPVRSRLRQAPCGHPRTSAGRRQSLQVETACGSETTELPLRQYKGEEGFGDETGEYGEQGRRRQQQKPGRQTGQAAQHSGSQAHHISQVGMLGSMPGCLAQKLMLVMAPTMDLSLSSYNARLGV